MLDSHLKSLSFDYDDDDEVNEEELVEPNKLIEQVQPKTKQDDKANQEVFL